MEKWAEKEIKRENGRAKKDNSEMKAGEKKERKNTWRKKRGELIKWRQKNWNEAIEYERNDGEGKR